jgi:hypothetical protein
MVPLVLAVWVLENPAAGDVIRGSAGLRKLRWSASGRGKRGGARVIAQLMKDITHG